MVSPSLRWLAQRAAHTLVVVWGAAPLTFIGLQLIPGAPARATAGGVQATASPAVLDLIRQEYGFDRPVLLQYLSYLARLARGDLGTSYQLNQPVSHVLAQQLWPTIQLALVSAVLGFTLAIVVATLTAGRPRPRSLARLLEFVSLSMPTFWIGILLLTFFSFKWQLFPVLGNRGIASLVLPSITLAVAISGLLAQVTRDGIERALGQPFVLTTRARGAGESRVRFRHALRHAALPLLTLSGWILGNLLGGIVVVETVFARQGLGQVLVSAVGGRDLPVVTGVVVVTSITFSLIAIALEQIYRVADPRLKASS